MFNKGNCDHKGKLQADTWYIIYTDKENVLFLFTSYYLNSSRKKKISLALYFIEFLSVNGLHSEKQYITKTSLQFLETAL